jgi:6-phosphogluconolactonase
MKKTSRIKLIWPDAESLATAAAHFIVTESNKAVTAKGYFTIALSGGKTPELLCKILARSPFKENIPWENIIIIFGDERFVPAASDESNYKMTNEALLKKVQIPKRNILKVKTEKISPAVSAALYEKSIKKYVSSKKPFDLILLGIGEEGHTASLFPGSVLLKEKKRLVKEVFVKEKNMYRISFTLPCINKAKNVLFIVTGENKKAILKKIFSERHRSLPAAMVKPAGNLIWMIDEAAAGKI